MSQLPGSQRATPAMATIRKVNTKPEIIVRKFLFKEGLRFRIHVKGLPGNPDIVLKKYNTVVFINGCFWHCHKGCKHHTIPRSRPEYWIPKLQGNVARDKQNRATLAALGWRTITVWECELAPKVRVSRLEALLTEIRQDK